MPFYDKLSNKMFFNIYLKKKNQLLQIYYRYTYLIFSSWLFQNISATLKLKIYENIFTN